MNTPKASERIKDMANFSIEKTPIDGLLVVTSRVYCDERGCFFESYHKEALQQLGLKTDFVQDNVSRSAKGVIRGMHFQKYYPQGKLVRAIAGRIFDVAVDLRENSGTFKQWFGIELSPENGLALFIPAGFAHGFLALEDQTCVHYKATDYYHPEDEGGFRYDDPEVSIQWPRIDGDFITSKKDQALPYLEQAMAWVVIHA